ncbi:MAG: tetratricopeptide repeat protein [Candidatus Omnitrophota bacterium]|jgi:tetratricopeptide (TPR) repeat protein
MLIHLSKNQTTPISIILISILGLAVYANSLNGKFVWDDQYLVEENTDIRSWSNIPKLLTQDIAAGAGEQFDFYRPFQTFTYMIDYSIWKLDVRGYHLSNILFHILAALSIFWLVNLLFDDRSLSLLSSIFFVVHPVHTEAVSYISGRSDPLSVLFLLLCLVFYIKYLNLGSGAWLIFAILSYILAVLSRENALILPLLLLLYHYSFRKKLKILPLLSIIAITLFYSILRFTILRALLPQIDTPYTLAQRIPGFFVAIATYLRLLVMPVNLHMEYVGRLFNLLEPKVLMGILILFFLLIYMLRVRNTRRLEFFCISWFLLTLLPVSNLYPINAYMAEHWLYLPSIGFFILLAKGLSYFYRTRQWRIYILAILIGIVVFYSLLTFTQNYFWREPLILYERTLKYAPDSVRAHYNLGVMYEAINREQEAIKLYKKAIAINPDYTKAYNNLGAIYNTMGKREEAIELYKKAIEINPDYAKAKINLGNLYNTLGRREEAIALLKKAIEINPHLSEAYYNLGVVYNAINNHEQAIAYFSKAIEINPDYIEAYNNLGSIYSAIHKKEEAIAIFMKAIEINPDYAKAYSNLGAVYSDVNKHEQAIASLKKAIEINPNLTETHYNLGVVYEAIGKRQEAIAAYKKAIEIDPLRAIVYNNLSIIYFQQKQYELAIEYFERARELGFTNPMLQEALQPHRAGE